MKTVPAPLQTLIAKQVTTLAYMWIITRQDGIIFRFTDHDRNILYDGEWYEALSGFTRSTLAAKSDLSVDNTDVQGLYDSDQITEEDLRKGFFDFAEFEIFLADWTVIDSTDKILLRKGFLGQVSLRETAFEVEQRGLTQMLSIVAGDVYSPLCRVDLFSVACGLTAASFLQQEVVAAVTNRRKFTAETKKTVFYDPAFTEAEAVEVSIDSTTGFATRDAATPDGTAAHPFQISTPAELNDIRDDVTAYYVLTQDIDMVAFGNWTPIQGFQGQLDGRGFEVQNLDLDDTGTSPVYANGDGGWGLFGSIGVNGVVKRLGVKDCTAQVGAGSDAPMGTLCGYCMGKIEDCWAEGGSVTVTNNAYTGIGGFVGRIRRQKTFESGTRLVEGPRDRGTVTRSWAAVLMSGTIDTGKHGGFSGMTDSDAQALEVNTFFDSDVATTTSTGNGGQATALTTAQAQQSSNYTGFDFETDWKANDGVDYPRHLDPGRGSTDPFLRFDAQDLTFAGTYGSSAVSWTEDLPPLTSIVVSVATDGETFTSVSNGGPLPGFSPSDPLSNVFVTVRVDFQTSGSNNPTLEDLTVEVTGQADAFNGLALGDSEWFKGGQLKWTSGLNDGVAMEVKSWDPGTKEIILFLEMPFDIAAGDTFDIYPGCQKRFTEDCKTKFVNGDNFRGEPYVPGTDHLLRVPDAQR